MWLWQPQLPVARMDHGGSTTPPLWPLHSQPPSLLHSVFLTSCPANRIIHRTAVYGPVRTVVWEGRCREAPPYPDFYGHPRFSQRRSSRVDIAEIGRSPTCPTRLSSSRSVRAAAARADAGPPLNFVGQ